MLMETQPLTRPTPHLPQVVKSTIGITDPFTQHSQSTAEILRDHHHNYIPLPLFRGFQPGNNKTLQTRRREIKKTNNSIYYN